ncbi:hypothetical protein EMCRGX_G003991 [Ephydatia muelleri]
MKLVRKIGHEVDEPEDPPEDPLPPVADDVEVPAPKQGGGRRRGGESKRARATWTDVSVPVTHHIDSFCYF